MLEAKIDFKTPLKTKLSIHLVHYTKIKYNAYIHKTVFIKPCPHYRRPKNSRRNRRQYSPSVDEALDFYAALMPSAQRISGAMGFFFAITVLLCTGVWMQTGNTFIKVRTVNQVVQWSPF